MQVTYRKLLRFQFETWQWLQRQPDADRAVEQLVAINCFWEKHKLEPQIETYKGKSLSVEDLLRQQLYNLKQEFYDEQRQRVEAEYLSLQYQEQLEISQEQIKTLQNQLVLKIKR